MSAVAPFLHPHADEVDDFKLDFLALGVVEQLGLLLVRLAPSSMFRHAIEIAGASPALGLDGRLAARDLPMTFRLAERRIDDWRVDFGNGWC